MFSIVLQTINYTHKKLSPLEKVAFMTFRVDSISLGPELFLEEFGIQLSQLVGGDAHCSQLAHEVVHLALHEQLSALLDDNVACLGRDKVAQPTLGVDDAVVLQVVVGASHGVGIDLDLCCKLTHAGYLAVGSETASQDVVAYAVGNLQIYGFVILEIHDLFTC